MWIVLAETNMSYKWISSGMFLILNALVLLLLGQGTAAGDHVYRLSRATIVDNELHTWRDGIVYFTFDNSVSMRLQNVIRDAMNEWEDSTCLLFRARDADQPDYVEFQSRPNEEYCTCDSVGRAGGKQEIKLGYSCQSKGEILHILGHIVGFWHEQARPDRNKFVRINLDNIEPGQEAKFEMRDDFDIDYQDVGYDYRSIMHLTAIAYSKDGSDTTEVNNQVEYNQQGKPKLGQRNGLSDKDIDQVNALYSCPVEGLRGILKINILNAEYLTETANPRVEITVVDASGSHTILSTTEKNIETDDVRKPEWGESFELPMNGPPPFAWQFFRLRILGGERFNDKPLSMSETIRITPGVHSSLKHCVNTFCRGFLMYSYEFDEDGDECDPNPCQNGGTCVDGFVNYECNCLRGWGGKNCEIDESGNSCEPNPCHPTNTLRCVDGFFDFTCECRPGFGGPDCSIDLCIGRCLNGGTCIHQDTARGYRCLCRDGYGSEDEGSCDEICFSIRVRNAVGLRDDDPGSGHSDPYVVVYVYDSLGTQYKHQTHAIDSSSNPEWLSTFNTGCGRQWDRFDFKIWDEDSGPFRGDDDLQYTGPFTYVGRIETRCGFRVGLGGSTRIYFDYHVYPRGSSKGPGYCD